MDIVLGSSKNKLFEPFNRFAQQKEDQSWPIKDLLLDFRELRSKNLDELKSLKITQNELKRTGIHPEFGKVTLEQLIAAWTVHDLGHIGQISRVVAKQYTKEVGPWIAYPGILKK